MARGGAAGVASASSACIGGDSSWSSADPCVVETRGEDHSVVEPGTHAGLCHISGDRAIDASVVRAAIASGAAAISGTGRGVDGALGLKEALDSKEGLAGLGGGGKEEGDGKGGCFLKH